MANEPDPRLLPRDAVTAVGGGLLFGLAFAWLASDVAAGFVPAEWMRWFKLITALIMSVTAVQLLLATADRVDAFAASSGSVAPWLLDTSALIDGRIADLVRAKLLDSPLAVPDFVVAELQAIADSSDKTRRARGRRGLDVLNELKPVVFHEPARSAVEQPVDARLIEAAKRMSAKLVTVDFNLQKAAQAHGVVVVNLHEIATALKPPCAPGDSLTLDIVRPGEQATQGVGYLEDGTMVVVEGAREHVGRRVQLTVTSVAQTSAGRMVFGRCDGVQA